MTAKSSPGHYVCLIICIGLLSLLSACTDSGLKTEIVTAENKDEIVEKAKTELTFEEVESLVTYLDEKKPCRLLLTRKRPLQVPSLLM